MTGVERIMKALGSGWITRLCCALLWAVPAQAKEPPAKIEIRYESKLANANHPAILYWFVTAETLQEGQVVRDLERISQKSPFDLIFLTDRGAGFYETERMHPVFADLVKRAHDLGLKIGLQVWLKSGQVAVEEAQAVVVEGECVLDASGRAEITGTTRNVRSSRPLKSDVLRVFLFKKRAEGIYDPATLIDATRQFVKTVRSDEKSVELRIEAPASFAGYTAYVMTVHVHEYPDLFSDCAIKRFDGILNDYSDIPFDGTALDEFGWMAMEPNLPKDQLLRERGYGQAFASSFKDQTGEDLERVLFDMRYAPLGQPSVRMRAINLYFDVWRQGPLRVENAFAKRSKQLFGEEAFAGVHNTYHNRLTQDEIWRTCCNWWALPREYGQTDENICAPVRMGVLCSAPRNVMYDMYYWMDKRGFSRKAMEDARFGGRIHYHAYNDNGRWGKDLADEDFLDEIRPVEEKIRLLNRFNPSAPKLPLLIVFGTPALTNWYPDEAARNNYDINGGLDIMEKANEVWKSGTPCALIPSTSIEDGRIEVDEKGRPVYNGRTFDALLYLYPQYSKEGVIAFLERVARAGGKFMTEGSMTHDFTGNDVSDRWKGIEGRATVKGFALDDLPKLHIAKNDVPGGCRMADGSVILTDLESIQSGEGKAYRLEINGHAYSGAFCGVLALKADKKGNLEKLACGAFSTLTRDGKAVLSLKSPADFYLERSSDGRYDAIVVGDEGSNGIALSVNIQ